MRLLIPILLVACTEPAKRPMQPDEPGGVPGCQSRPTELGGVHYDCTMIGHSYEVVDSAGPVVSIATVRDRLRASGEKLGAKVTTGPHTIAGVEDSILVEYQKAGKTAFDVVAATAVEGYTRLTQCHVEWFDSGRVGRLDNCDRTIGSVVKRPSPAPKVIQGDCGKALDQLSKLPGRPDDEEMRGVLRSTMARCNDALAACILASTTYVEASVCTDR